MHIQAVRESSAGYFFKVNDWSATHIKKSLIRSAYHKHLSIRNFTSCKVFSLVDMMTCTYVFKLSIVNVWLTWTMKKLAQPPQLAKSIKGPATQCWLVESVVLVPWLCAWPRMISTMGPLYSVITMAPPTVITVPTTFARLCSFLTFTLSNLINQNNNIIRIGLRQTNHY